MKKLMMISVIMLMVIVGCGKKGSPDYWPLAEGNRWTYKNTVNDTLTYETETVVESAVTIGDIGDGWKLKSTRDTVVSYSYVYKGADTVYVYKDENGDTVTYWEPVDLETGTSWEVQNPLMADVVTKYEVIGDEDVTVEAGTFTGAKKVKATYSYEQDMGMLGKTITNYEAYIYRVDGVGMVKQEATLTTVTVDTTGTDTTSTLETKTVVELKSYEVK